MNFNIKTRVALYMRADTDEKRDSSYTLKFQEERLSRFINSQHDVILEKSHIYKDNNLSGTLPIESRPALKKLFKDGANEEFDVVYVYKLDRFSQKLSILVNGIDRLEKSNIELRSITESFDTNTTVGHFMMMNLGAFIEMETSIKKQVRK